MSEGRRQSSLHWPLPPPSPPTFSVAPAPGRSASRCPRKNPARKRLRCRTSPASGRPSTTPNASTEYCRSTACNRPTPTNSPRSVADTASSCFKHVRPRDTRTEMYAGRVVCRPLVSHVEYVPRALLRLEKTGQTDGQTDRRTNARPLHYAYR